MHKSYSYIVLFYLLLIPFFGLGQWKCLLRNEAGEPIQGAIVSIQSIGDDSKILFHATSSSIGTFEYDKPVFPFALHVRALSYEMYEYEIKSKDELPDTIVLRNASILLEDVLIEMNTGFASIREDTIKYKLDKLNLKDNDNLKEILNRIPGFKVDDNYRIVHAGQEINKILVNGKEVFEFQNKIALDNIEAGVLDGLNIINEYVDPFKINIEPNASEKVIDLKVKDSFTSFLKGNVELQGGYRNKFKVKPFLFYFSESFSVFTLNNFNNLLDKDWSSDDYAGANRSNNVESRYYGVGNRKVFYSKDPTLNQEKSFLNSTTLKRSNEKYALQAVFNFNKLHSLKYLHSNTHYLGAQYTQKNSIDSTKASLWSYTLDFRYKVFKSSIFQVISSSYQDRLDNQYKFDAIYYFDDLRMNIGEHTRQGSQIYANKFVLDTKLANNLSWHNSWLIRDEKNVDRWTLSSDLTYDTHHPSMNVKDMLVGNKEHTLTSSIGHKINREITLEYALQYQKQNIAIEFTRLNHQRIKPAALIEGEYKSKYVNIDLAFAYNLTQQKLELQRKNNQYLASTLHSAVFLDRFKKNKIKVNYQNANYSPSLYTAIDSNIISYDRMNVGRAGYLLELFRRRVLQISYVYDLPFKGQSMQVSYFKRYHSDAIVPTLSANSNIIWDYMRVKGLDRQGGDITYSQHIFKQFFPTKVDFSYQLHQDIYYQYALPDNFQIKQWTHQVGLGFNSFSKSSVNLLAKMSWEWNNIYYIGLSDSKQQIKSFILGPRFVKNTLGIKSLLKYNIINDEVRSKRFVDIDFNATYQLSKRLDLLISMENFLQNLGIKGNNELSLINNQNGFEYFESYKNIIGYSVAGIKYRL